MSFSLTVHENWRFDVGHNSPLSFGTAHWHLLGWGRVSEIWDFSPEAVYDVLQCCHKCKTKTTWEVRHSFSWRPLGLGWWFYRWWKREGRENAVYLERMTTSGTILGWLGTILVLETFVWRTNKSLGNFICLNFSYKLGNLSSVSGIYWVLTLFGIVREG